MSAPNVVNVITFTGKSSVLAPTITPTAIIANSANSGQVYKVNSLVVANISGSAATISASLYRNSTQSYFAYNISVPVGATLVVMDKATTIYLEEGDAVYLTTGTNSALSAVISYEILS